MRESYRRLEDRTGIDERGLRFAGFDAAVEPRQFHLTRLLLDMDARFAELRDDASSHDESREHLEIYRRMLARFRWYWDPREADACLTRDELLDVLAAAVQPPETQHDSRTRDHAVGDNAGEHAADSRSA